MCHFDMCLLPTSPPLPVYILFHRHKWVWFHECTWLVPGQNNHQADGEQHTAFWHFVLKHTDKQKPILNIKINSHISKLGCLMILPCSPPRNQSRRTNPRCLRHILSRDEWTQQEQSEEPSSESDRLMIVGGHFPKELRSWGTVNIEADLLSSVLLFGGQAGFVYSCQITCHILSCSKVARVNRSKFCTAVCNIFPHNDTLQCTTCT